MDQQTKEILKHDQFAETTASGIDWVSANRGTLVTAAIGIAVALVVVIGGFVYYNHRSEQAATEYGAAMQAYQTPIAQPGQAVPPGVKTYPSVLERAKAANAMFLAVADKYGMTHSGKLSLYFAGLTEIEAGQNGEAEANLKKVADGWNADLAALAKLSLAQLYRQTNRDAQAIEVYNQLTAKPTSTVPAGLAQLQLAELYESEGKPAEAKKIYAQLKDKDAKGPVGQLAQQKLNPSPAGGPGGAIQAQ